jgi:hypothetical protein
MVKPITAAYAIVVEKRKLKRSQADTLGKRQVIKKSRTVICAASKVYIRVR